MMWHFYEIPYIPDLELVKYQSLGEQGIDGILERHNRFLRQWQRNTVLIHTTLHFFLSYTHERPKGSRLQIFLAFSSDQTVNFESIDALMQASPLADYYKIAPIEDVPVCLRKSFANILLVKKQEQTRLSTGDTLFTVEGWKSNPKSRLYEMEKTAEALNEDMVYHISIYGSDTYKTAQQALQKPIAILREKALGRSGQITLADNKNRPRDVSAEETLRIYEEFLSDVAKSPCFFANILLYANQKSSAHFLMDAVCGEAIKEGTCEIQEIPSTATPLELQEVNQPYCNLLPPSLAFWPTAYTLTQKANSGDAVAMRKLGYEYLIGKNIQKDEKKAFQLFRAAVWEGDLNATIYCGYCCKTGAGLEKPNIVAAARYYEYGARAGVAAAQYELARIYIDKEMGDACFIGGANPYFGCERWLKKAAEQNYIYAEELLADKYYEGVYIVKDVKAAIYWYEKAANQGNVYAMYRAGYIYYSEPIDYNKAGQWFSLAAEKGDKDAEEVLRNNLRYNRFTKKWDAVR